ncbi:MAG: di-trans,poly-cis-decaprenylcistransferase [Phycisphaerales bacterium]|nr:di-trans,poly-cis-decaprenylcistransferase [Phycisphaerales bacterium]
MNGARLTPRHIAIIMDGNGRWAQSRGLPRVAGHRAGALAIRPVLAAAADAGVEVLTLYSFSSENWTRPAPEIDALMALCCEKLAEEHASLIEMGVRIRRIGRRDGMPEEVLRAFDFAERATAGGRKITLALAINYGSRGEIADAARAIARQVACGEVSPDSVNEELVAANLSTHDLPDPDFLIRTGGQKRLSNYLLWQLSYAEIRFVPTLWPDFGPADLREAIADYSNRKRTFGGITTDGIDSGNPSLGCAESSGIEGAVRES